MPPATSDIQRKQLYQRSGWIPKSPLIRQEFLRKCREKCTANMNARTEHKPSVTRFEDAIRAEPAMLDLFNKSFVQASCLQAAELPATNFEDLLNQLDVIICQAPSFCFLKDANGKDVGEPISCPIWIYLDLLGNTQAGYDLFRMPAFNAAMKDLLDAWGAYLVSPPSSSVLNNGPEGWFSPAAIRMLEFGRGTFDDTYVLPDHTSDNKGFESWDAFFTRELQTNARPILNKDDPSVILNSCEGTVYRIAHNVKLQDRFWLKTQPYSLHDMLDQSEYASRFVGGTVYQIYLDPMDYHRWHAPISGTIVRTALIPGTYFADEGAPDNGDPHDNLDRSLGWLTTAAARALIFIESGNTDIGLMCFIGIGMCEVSTCELLVKEGDRVSAGEQIGMFHFGGSSSALIFGPQVKLILEKGVEQGSHQQINTPMARLESQAAVPMARRSWFGIW